MTQLSVFGAADGTILTWNKAAERLFGFTEGEAVGGPVKLLVPSDAEEPTGVFASVMAGDEVVAYETTRLTKGGERIPVSVTASRMRATNGRVLGVCATFQDLRPRVEAEAALREVA